MKNVTMLLVALSLSVASIPAQAIDWPGRDKGDDVSTPGEFKSWADDRLERTREDLDKVGRRLQSHDRKVRDGMGDNVMKLKERISKVEGRLEEAGDRNDKESWKTREDVRDEIKDIREDVTSLNRKLDKKADRR